MIERLYISEIQQKLKYKDRRSVRRWCKNQNVRVLQDIGSNKQFVLKDEFENAKYRNYSQPYGILNSARLILNDNCKMETEYKPQYKIEKHVLSIFQNLTPTL
jgi:hypothetical protein